MYTLQAAESKTYQHLKTTNAEQASKKVRLYIIDSYFIDMNIKCK